MKKLTLGLLVLGLSSATFAYADNVVYAITDTGTNEPAAFGTLDLTNQVFTPVSELNPGTAQAGFIQAGLGEINGTLYAADYTAQGLYTVNPTTGQETFVGDSQVGANLPSGVYPTGFYDFGSTTTGLYALDSAGNVYSIDPVTAMATKIGNTGVVPPSNNAIHPNLVGFSGLSVNSGTLYLTNNDTLYSVNTSTGLATEVVSNITGATSLLSLNGTLYGASNILYSFDTGSGTQTTIGPISGTASSDIEIYGMAPAPVPLPSSVFLLLGGLAALGFAASSRRPRMDGAMRAAV